MSSPGQWELVHPRTAKLILASGESRCGTYREPAAKPGKGYSPLAKVKPNWKTRAKIQGLQSPKILVRFPG
jgi:hypothetical protein